MQATIATTNANGKTNSAIPHESPILIEGVPTYYFERQRPWNYAFSWPLTRWLKMHVPDYDLIHIHAVFSYATAAAAYYARKYQVPYIILPHGMLDPWSLSKSWLAKKIYLMLVEKRNIEQAAAVHFTAEDELRTCFSFRGSKFVLPCLLDLGELQMSPPKGSFKGKHPEMKDKTLILFLSRIDRKKGLDLLIAALARLALRRDDFLFILAGSGDETYERQVTLMINKAGLTARTVRTGFVDGVEKAALLADADIFVLPSYQDNYGIAVVEAMAAGLPVVISNKVNIHNGIAQAGAGLVVSLHVGELAEAIVRLLEEPSLRASMGKRAQRLIQEKYAPAPVVQEMVQIYRDVIEGSYESAAWRITPDSTDCTNRIATRSR